MSAILRFSALLYDTLREIFDETAYERFLRRNNAIESAASYRSFQKEQQLAKERRVKCC